MAFSAASQVELSTVNKLNNEPKGFCGILPNQWRSRDISPPPGCPTYSFATPTFSNEEWNPCNTFMVRYHRRLDTFKAWPRQLVQQPQQLARSGFYYSGRGDLVTCFFCGIPLKNWERVDNVDFEHKKHSPNCKYLLMSSDI